MYCIETVQASQKITNATKVQFNNVEYLVLARNDHISLCNFDLKELNRICIYTPIEQIVPLTNSFLCFTNNFVFKILYKDKKLVYEKQKLILTNFVKKTTGFSKSLSTKNYFVLKSHENMLVIGFKSEDEYVLDQTVCDLTYLEALDFTGDQNKLIVMYKGTEVRNDDEQENIKNDTKDKLNTKDKIFDNSKLYNNHLYNTFIAIYKYKNKKFTVTETVQVQNIYKIVSYKNGTLLFDQDFMYRLEDARNNIEKKRKASQERETKNNEQDLLCKEKCMRGIINENDPNKNYEEINYNYRCVKSTKKTAKIVRLSKIPNTCVIDCLKISNVIYLLCSNREFLCFCDNKFSSFGFIDFYIDKIIHLHENTFFGSSFNDNSILFELNDYKTKNEKAYNQNIGNNVSTTDKINITHEFQNKHIKTIKTIVNNSAQNKIDVQNNTLTTKIGYNKDTLCFINNCVKFRNKSEVVFKHKIRNLFVYKHLLFVSFTNSFVIYDYKKMKIVRRYKNCIQNFYVPENTTNIEQQYSSSLLKYEVRSDMQSYQELTSKQTSDNQDKNMHASNYSTDTSHNQCDSDNETIKKYKFDSKITNSKCNNDNTYVNCTANEFDQTQETKQDDVFTHVNCTDLQKDYKTFYSLSLHSDKKDSNKQKSNFILNTENEMITKNDIFSTNYKIILSSFYNNLKLLYGRRNNDKILLLCDEDSIKKEISVNYNISHILLSQHVFVSTFDDKFIVFDYEFRAIQTIKIETFSFGFLLQQNKNPSKNTNYSTVEMNVNDRTEMKYKIECIFGTQNGSVYFFDGIFTKVFDFSAIIYKIAQVRNSFFVRSDNNYILKIKKELQQPNKLNYKVLKLEDNDIECMVDSKDKQIFYSVKDKVYITKSSLKTKLQKKTKKYENEINEIIQIKNTNKKILVFTKQSNKKLRTICVLYKKDKKICKMYFDGIFKAAKVGENVCDNNISYNDSENLNEEKVYKNITNTHKNNKRYIKKILYICINFIEPNHNKIYAIDFENEFKILCEITNENLLHSFDVFGNLMLIGLSQRILICTITKNEICETGVIRDVLLPRNVTIIEDEINDKKTNSYFVIVNGHFVTNVYHFNTQKILKEIYKFKRNYQSCIKINKNTILLYKKNKVCYFTLKECKIIKEIKLTENIIDAKNGSLEGENKQIVRYNKENEANTISNLCIQCCSNSHMCKNCCEQTNTELISNLTNLTYFLTAFGTVQKIYYAKKYLSDSEIEKLKAMQLEITKNDIFLHDLPDIDNVLYVDIIKNKLKNKYYENKKICKIIKKLDKNI